MSTSSKIAQFLLSIDGTNQKQREGKALAKDYVGLDERSSHDMLAFVLQLAGQVRYIDLNNQSAGDWRPFLSPFMADGRLLSGSELEDLARTRSDWTPHAALLWAFLKILDVARRDINALVHRHLDFYYREVLQLARRKAGPDKLHVVLSLAKNASPTLLPAGTLLAAGSSQGLPRQYALDHEVVVSAAAVDRLMSLFIDRNKAGQQILFKAEDATSVVLNQSSDAWRPFGLPQLATGASARRMEMAAIGFSVASPALRLAEGNRSIVLTLALSAEVMPAPQVLTTAFEVELTTEEGWLPPVKVTSRLTTEGALRLDVEVDASFPPIIDFDGEIHDGDYRTRWPVIRCRLRPESYNLEKLRSLQVTEVVIAVSVKGMRDLVLQNDQAVQIPDQPVLPFGAQPAIGSHFYIGSPEAFHKSLTSFAVHLTWQDPPPNMLDHYRAYGVTVMTNNGTFVADLSILAGRAWQSAGVGGQFLFEADPSLVRSIAVNPSTLGDVIADSPFKRLPEAESFTNFTNRRNQGFIRLTLAQPERGEVPGQAEFEAFGHKIFASVNTRQAIALAQGDTGAELPNVPYTPTLESVALDYNAEEAFEPSSPNGIDAFFSEDVFGPREVGSGESATLLPEVPGLTAGATEDTRSGALYIGLKDASASQTVSMLLEIAEGTAPGATLLGKEEMVWSYLSETGWTEVDTAGLLEDSTDELQQTGLIRLNIGQDAVGDATEMPSGLHWLRLAALDHADGASSVASIVAQAARATLIAQTQDGEQQPLLPETLEAGTVSGLVVKNRAIKSVEQPHQSFGGRAEEEDAAYFRRIRERIRHRNRAVTIWDYERMILERFPEIFKVKCTPHSDEENQTVPGAVRAVVIPDWRKRSTGNPLQPAANAAFLRQVEETLVEFTTPFTRVHVTNPAFETLLIDCTVVFYPEFDPGYYSVQLEEEIKKFLSPWAYDEGEDIVFGGKVYRSEILAFVEGRDYVDHVLEFQLYHRHSSGPLGGIGEMTIDEDFVIGESPNVTVGTATIGEDFVVGMPVEVAGATRPDAVLVSNASHRIDVLQGEASCPGTFQTGIGQMLIGIDFIVVT